VFLTSTHPLDRINATAIALAVVTAAAVATLLAISVAHLDALIVLAAMLGVVALAVLTVWTDGAMLLAVFVLYSNIAVVLRNTSLPPAALAASSALLLVVPAAHQVFVRRERPRVDGVLALMAILLVARFVSTFAAKDGFIALGVIGQYAAEGIALYWLLLNVIRSRQRLTRVMWMAVLTAAFLATLSVYQEATGSYTQQFGGLAPRELRHVLAAQAEGRAAPESDDGDVGVADRAAGPVGDPNRYAQILLVVAPFAVFFFWNAPTRRLRLVAALAAGLVLGGVVVTYSRGAFLTMGGMVAMLVVLGHVRLRHAVLGLAAVSIVTVAAAPTYVGRMATIMTSSALINSDAERAPDGAIRGRATEMFAALAVFVDHPILGVGPGQYVPFYSQRYQLKEEIKFRDLPRPRQAHNLFLAVGAESGAVGLALFLAIPGLLARRLLEARRYWSIRESKYAHVATAFLFSLIAYFGTGLFLHLAFERYFWFLLGTAGAAVKVLRTEALAREIVSRGGWIRTSWNR
jgi:hypothetical protein